MDVPRLSTIQALLLLLKARESNPSKGYFYRSWQTVKTMISMAKDLDIHEHYSLHKDGRTCNLDPVDCLVQTRVWQTLLVVEVMTGGPQGWCHLLFVFSNQENNQDSTYRRSLRLRSRSKYGRYATICGC